MSHSTDEDHFDPKDFQSYVEDLVIEALHDGMIAPATLLECIYCALEPDLFAALRAISALGPGERLMVMSYAKKLSDGRTTVV